MNFTGKRIKKLMRLNKITIEQLSIKMQVTQKRIRWIRENGCENHLIFQDYIDAITKQ